MPGFKEPLLTKVLCVVYPERFLPLFSYTAEGTGKRELTESVFGLHLPVKPDATAMQIGRLAVWSNDLLLELVGDGFTGTHHAAAFLLWAKDRAGARPPAGALTPGSLRRPNRLRSRRHPPWRRGC